MITGDEAKLFAAAREGDHDAFQRLTDPYRRELLVHCYRMLGSLEDAEDILQETLLRAWRKLHSSRGEPRLERGCIRLPPTSHLTYLAAVALGRCPKRFLSPCRPFCAAAPTRNRIIWLGPLPDLLVDERPTANPGGAVRSPGECRIGVLARAPEAAGPAARGAHRARRVRLEGEPGCRSARHNGGGSEQCLAACPSDHEAVPWREQPRVTPAARPADEQIASLLAKYVAAWEEADLKALVALLREDAFITMPPFPLWYHGREVIQQFLDTHLFTGDARGRLRLVETRANGAPAFGAYQRDAEGSYRPVALHVVTVEGDKIARIDEFLTYDDRLFTQFGLPLSV